jgi:hypothetical protein
MVRQVCPQFDPRVNQATPALPYAVAFNPRCGHVFENGTRCRLPVRYPERPYCPRHSDLPEHLDAPIDISPILFEGLTEWNDPHSLRIILSRLSRLVAEGRVVPRQARTLAYIASLIQQSLRLMPKFPHPPDAP